MSRDKQVPALESACSNYRQHHLLTTSASQQLQLAERGLLLAAN